MKAMVRSLFAVVSIACGVCLALGGAVRSDENDTAGTVKLERLNWSKFQERLRENQKIKYTLVDAWSTTCGPCKENFPHVLEMHKKYADKGLQVVSPSLRRSRRRCGHQRSRRSSSPPEIDDHQHPAGRGLRRRIRETEHQRDSRRICIWAGWQGSETVHHGRHQESVHLRGSREGDYHASGRQAISHEAIIKATLFVRVRYP